MGFLWSTRFQSCKASTIAAQHSSFQDPKLDLAEEFHGACQGISRVVSSNYSEVWLWRSLCLRLFQNGLKSLSGIQVAKGLKFLIVSNNQLTGLEGLVSLPKLMVLDAAENSINKIDCGKFSNRQSELPQSLSFLYVEGNPCCDSQEGLREYLRTALPNLKELDGDPLTDYSCSDYSTESDEASEQEEEEDEEHEEDEEGTGRARTEEDDHGGESKQRACKAQVFRATEDGGKDVPIDGEGCSGSRRPGTSSEAGSSSSRGASTSCNHPLTLSPLPEIVERLGTPSSVERALGSSPIPHPDIALENVSEEDMVEFYNLKDSLYESNLDLEGAVQTVLSHTVGGLGHHCDMMIERAHERMKDLDVRVGEEIAEMFFNPETSPGSTSTLKEQSQEASSSGDISSSVMSPISVDHWKYVASTSSDSSNCKDSSSVGNTDCVDQSYQESLTSEQEGSGEI
ncbi:hypothetical protein AXG93_2402s1340 [Marchantia polymorpha subsp. ruderalis]|uniref:U2A'/phosphoprotein 32 family A C-terminal domain-containing protein n=1 Tax=Marchantia polymorpha subsp. ruderalis TaxID=1480154 RepID=A0A176VVC0_MARPO|nr:hypothetical protein AXG93_2402s1340 [Marchantia polymorpha subsp. ruderalis]